MAKVAGPTSAEEFRARGAALLDELAGEEVRLAVGLWRWWRRAAEEGDRASGG